MLKFVGGSCGCLKTEKTAERNKARGAALKSGDTFGRLTVCEDHGCEKVTCICSCGNSVVALRASLRSGTTASCGCLRSELVRQKNLTHGMSELPIYRVWRGIVERCTNQSSKAYTNYGARGITLCEDWLRFESFYRDVGSPPFEGASLDRIDNNKGYYKENCRWATRAEQAANTRRNRWYSFHGRLFMLKDIAEISGTDAGYLYYRVNNMKDSIESAVSAKFPKTDWAAVVKGLPKDKYLQPTGEN